MRLQGVSKQVGVQSCSMLRSGLGPREDRSCLQRDGRQNIASRRNVAAEGWKRAGGLMYS